MLTEPRGQKSAVQLHTNCTFEKSNCTKAAKVHFKKQLHYQLHQNQNNESQHFNYNLGVICAVVQLIYN